MKLNLDVVILCGGEGKRLKALVKNIPKVMVKVNGMPFLRILIDYFKKFGCRRFILCVGHKKDIIKNYFSSYKDGRTQIIFSEEDNLLGTGGALRNAYDFIKTGNLFVSNGDSFFGINIRNFYKFHIIKKADISIAITKKSGKRFGMIIKDETGRVRNFREKVKNANGFINGGIYIFKKEIIKLIPKRKNSLELDFFSKVISKKRIYGYFEEAPFIDIGIPSSYKKAGRFFKEITEK